MGEAAEAARSVMSSRGYGWFVRVGLVAYGVVHLVVAWLAVRLALGVRRPGEEASNTGALRSIAENPIGVVSLWVAAAGFFVLVVWQAVSALIGFREFDGFRRVARRLSAGLRTLVYGYLGVGAAGIAAGPGGGEGEAEESVSRGLLGLPFGRLLAAVVGLAVVGYGVALVVRAFRESFNDDLSTTLSGVPRRLTQAGFVGKGIAVGIVGGLFLWAAAESDPTKAGGLDEALQRVLEQPFGVWLLILLAFGIASYGGYCFFWARHPKRP